MRVVVGSEKISHGLSLAVGDGVVLERGALVRNIVATEGLLRLKIGKGFGHKVLGGSSIDFEQLSGDPARGG